MQKHKGSKSRSPDAATEIVDDGPGAKSKLKRKEYEVELRKLHAELVKLQEWVRHEGQKVCILFEGRDGAGKGGVIKAITARVSPRYSGSWRCRLRPTAKSRRCTFSGTCRICRPEARS
jgi:polyphosphate kinase 2 (PPK2 family)